MAAFHANIALTAVLVGFLVHACAAAPAADAACNSNCAEASVPDGCTPLTPSTDGEALVVSSCMSVASGTYVYGYVNVVAGGTLFFVDDGGQINFAASSILIEQGGSFVAGAYCLPFGCAGGTLDIALYGSDPTNSGAQAPSTPGIQCVGVGGCYDASLVGNCCTVTGSTNPCTNTTCPSTNYNAYFEGYDSGGLNYDGAGNTFGFKVFAVSYGGTLKLFGRKGVNAADYTPTRDRVCAVPANQTDAASWAALSGGGWGRLDATAMPGDTSFTADRPVTFSAGDNVVLTTTDWYVNHTEHLVVGGAGVSEGTSVPLAGPVQYRHQGEVTQVDPVLLSKSGNPNGEVDGRAAYALLTRSIRVRSLGATASDPFPAPADCGTTESGSVTPSCFFGGHVIARQGFAVFQVQGVEFYQLGQGGRMGHYPVHFHLAKSVEYTEAFVRDCAVWDSMTRFIVLHGTQGVELSRNVGFMSVGHGYYLEDGSEINNLLCHNIGISARSATIEMGLAQNTSSPLYRAVPGILPATGTQGADPPTNTATNFQGSDYLQPTHFWIMNAANEFVGNMAVGTHGYGVCFWLLGAVLSGPSYNLHWTSGTGTIADGPTWAKEAHQLPLTRFRGNQCGTSAYGLQTTLEVDPNTAAEAGYTFLQTPYDTTVSSNFMYPNIGGNYVPSMPNTGGQSCPSQLPWGTDPSVLVESCVATVIDRFRTSFNWPSINFGAVWLRESWFMVMNAAITDQLSGGLGFVSGGDWTQAPTGYFAITFNSVFIGSTNQGDPAAGILGLPTAGLSCSAACTFPGAGTGVFVGGFGPKRMVSIYDGPFYSDGSVFANVPEVGCTLPDCGVYATTTQPVAGAGSNGYYTQTTIVNAAIGWKQPNGFYYPPAFAFKRSAFSNDTLRHNVVDQYVPYGTGSSVAPSILAFNVYQEDNITPIDATTILLDIDGSLTGAVASNHSRTSSVSRNYFFNAPSVDPECDSFGVQTSPYDLVSTVLANVAPASQSQMEDGLSFVVNNGPWPERPIIPIYRQLTLPTDTCGSPYSVCQGSAYGSSCTRAAFMMGTDTYQAPYLTMNRGVYYIDTSVQTVSSCCPACGASTTAQFVADSYYMLWNIYASPNTKVKYQIYVGEGFNPATDGQWVRTLPHSLAPGEGALQMPVVPDASGANFTGDAFVVNGTLFLTMDHSKIASDYAFKARPQASVCLPRDVCQLSADNATCVVADGFARREPELADEMDAICGYWGARTSGMYPGEQTTFADCPASGCLGYAFKMSSGFVPQPYAAVGAQLTSCFPRGGAWNVSLQQAPNDRSCPPPSAPSGFCPSPGTSVPNGGDAASYPGAIVPGVRGLEYLFDFFDGAEGFGSQSPKTDIERWRVAMARWNKAFENWERDEGCA